MGYNRLRKLIQSGHTFNAFLRRHFVQILSALIRDAFCGQHPVKSEKWQCDKTLCWEVVGL